MPKIFIYISSLIGVLLILIGGIVYSFAIKKNNQPQPQINTVQETNNQEEKKEEINNNLEPVNQEKKEEVNNNQEEKKEEIKNEEEKQEEKKEEIKKEEEKQEEKKEPEKEVEEERGFLYITMLVIFVLFAALDIFGEIMDINAICKANDKKNIVSHIVYIIIQTSMLLCSFLIKGKKISIIMFILEILFCFLKCYCCGCCKEAQKKQQQENQEALKNITQLDANVLKGTILKHQLIK